MNKSHRLISVLICLFASLPVLAVDNWKLIKIPVLNRPTPVCAIESVTRVINDGQAETPVKLIYTEQAFYAKTESHLDLSYAKTGLKIDTHSKYKIDRIKKQNTAIIESKMNALKKDLLAGRHARLTVGFWPTWPKSGTRNIEFSLIGFGKAYRQFKICRKNNR